MDVVVINYWLAMVATAAFAASAVVAVSDSKVDLFGAFVLGIVTALGGGTLRDLILDVPVFWSLEQSYLWVALFSGIITYLAKNIFDIDQYLKARRYLNTREQLYSIKHLTGILII